MKSRIELPSEQEIEGKLLSHELEFDLTGRRIVDLLIAMKDEKNKDNSIYHYIMNKIAAQDSGLFRYLRTKGF